METVRFLKCKWKRRTRFVNVSVRYEGTLCLSIWRNGLGAENVESWMGGEFSLVANILHCTKRHKEKPDQVNGDYFEPLLKTRQKCTNAKTRPLNVDYFVIWASGIQIVPVLFTDFMMTVHFSIKLNSWCCKRQIVSALFQKQMSHKILHFAKPSFFIFCSISFMLMTSNGQVHFHLKNALKIS